MINKLKSVATSLVASGIVNRDSNRNNNRTKDSDCGLSSACGSHKSVTGHEPSPAEQEGIHGVAVFVLGGDKYIQDCKIWPGNPIGRRSDRRKTV